MEGTCPKCHLPVRVFVTCACGAVRVRTNGGRRETEQEQLAQVVACVRSGANTTAAVRRMLQLSERRAARLVARGLALGLLGRDPGARGWLHARQP